MVHELLDVTWYQMFVFGLKMFTAFGLAGLCVMLPVLGLAALLEN